MCHKKRQMERNSSFEVSRFLSQIQSRIWNSVELYNLYNLNNDNVVVDCRTFIKNLLNYFDGARVSFHACGYAKLLCFNDHARGVLKMAKKGDASDDGIENLGRAINAECKEIKIDTDTYDFHFHIA